MDWAIETQALTKCYGPVRAMDGVNLRVARGEIYGFLGLNGAGKTTTIRALLGMVRPTSGSVRVLGQAVGPNGRGPWAQVGYLVEQPASYPELTVRENLEIARRLHRLADASATADVIERLNLGAYAGRKAGVLSTGNVQRLGLARALLHAPALLILDEPANGLDPAGVVEIRDLLTGLAQGQGVTIFMSSHILSEVDRLATRIGIIHQGRLLDELHAAQLDALRQRRLEVEARDPGAACALLAQAGYAPETRDDTIRLADARAVAAPDAVATLLVQGGAPPLRLTVVQEGLEEYFLRITGARL